MLNEHKPMQIDNPPTTSNVEWNDAKELTMSVTNAMWMRKGKGHSRISVSLFSPYWGHFYTLKIHFGAHSTIGL